MSWYFINQAIRAKECWVVKAIGLLVLAVVPGKADKVWDEHCERMQRKLDGERSMGWGKRYIDGKIIEL